LILDTQFYLPHASRRLIEVMPRLANVRVRRTWRATYPMTPDGSPLLGRVNGLEGYILATGMCGQGFMLGPGVGRLLAKLVTNALEPEDEIILEALQLERSYSSKEKLK
jgi:sarcosine oxidase subunit beta